MSGIDEASVEDSYSSLEMVLGRDKPLNALSSLASALDLPKADGLKISDCAICLDSNVLLKLASFNRREDIVDYFLAKHSAPLILSAQSIQEFWNNQLSGIGTVAKSLDENFKKLEDEVKKVGEDLGDFGERFSELLREFKENYGYLHDKNLRRNVVGLLEMLSKKAKVIEVPRHRFHRYTHFRQQTKTPPGFEDKRDGDFYIWADFLYGMNVCAKEGVPFKKAVMVTEDKKSDWSRGGVAHPVLTAEVFAYLNLPFETWGLKGLAELVEKYEP